MKKCQKCGATNPDAATLCNDCATRFQQSGGGVCPNGHPMDPTWTECHYCKQGNAAPVPVPSSVRTLTEWEVGQRVPAQSFSGRPITQKEDTPLPPRPSRPVGPPSPQPQPPAGGPPRKRDHTVFSPVTSPAGQVAPQVARDRKIIGILVTYSWSPEGQIFPLREGRNFIGRDKDCEVCIADDQTLSGRNSHITYRQNFVIGDMVSMTGTDVDGVPIEEQFRSLSNYATVRAGSTYFTFIAIAPPAPQAAQAAPEAT